MANHHRPRARKTTSADKRAERWLQVQRQSAREHIPAKVKAGAELTGAFAVRRSLAGAREGLFLGEMALALEAVLRGSKRIIPITTPAASLINPRFGRQLMRYQKRQLIDVIESVEDLVRDFPASVPARAGKALVLGKPKGQPGKRYVALGLFSDTKHQLETERAHILEALGCPEDRYNFTPHISLFETYDHGLAARAANNLNGLLARETPVLLGKAAVIQVSQENVLPLYQT